MRERGRSEGIRGFALECANRRASAANAQHNRRCLLRCDGVPLLHGALWMQPASGRPHSLESLEQQQQQQQRYIRSFVPSVRNTVILSAKVPRMKRGGVHGAGEDTQRFFLLRATRSCPHSKESSLFISHYAT
ncbi:hypothetical protein FQA47_011982 [Oryzias melastigma]|uniref:Uncharacterized protein n=1 Tax=Oryzias melastigma TaxID=30732 RepID=A0A834CNP0_ORYME|nr:hypothetical protein FQA47_011982 [Oryzias melastigma]